MFCICLLKVSNFIKGGRKKSNILKQLYMMKHALEKTRIIKLI